MCVTLAIVATRTSLVRHFPTRYLLFLQEGDGELASAATAELLARLQGRQLSAGEGERLLHAWHTSEVDHYSISRVYRVSRNGELVVSSRVDGIGFMPQRTRSGRRASLGTYTYNVKYNEIKIDGVAYQVRWDQGANDQVYVLAGMGPNLSLYLPDDDDHVIEVDAVVTMGTPWPGTATWNTRKRIVLSNDGPGAGISTTMATDHVQAPGAVIFPQPGAEDLMFPYGRPVPPSGPGIDGIEHDTRPQITRKPGDREQPR
ncbi:MAG: hypothetical protein H6817_07065 [Phycisphaerales bacterium]|nr:hypothetical protein [Phycisphaerales bacterium]